MRLLDIQDNSDFHISMPQCPTHYSPQGNGDVLDIVVHRNVRLSDVRVSDVLTWNHLPILDHFGARDVLFPVEILTDWERFRSLFSDLISPRIHTDAAADDDRAACNFAASTALAYKRSTHKLTLS